MRARFTVVSLALAIMAAVFLIRSGRAHPGGDPAARPADRGGRAARRVCSRCRAHLGMFYAPGVVAIVAVARVRGGR
jgi:hypothetical protein